MNPAGLGLGVGEESTLAHNLVTSHARLLPQCGTWKPDHGLSFKGVSTFAVRAVRWLLRVVRCLTMRTRTSLALCALLLIAPLTGAVKAQEPAGQTSAPTGGEPRTVIRTTVGRVVLDVVVTNSKGEPPLTTGTRLTLVKESWAIFIAARSNSEFAGEPATKRMPPCSGTPESRPGAAT